MPTIPTNGLTYKFPGMQPFGEQSSDGDLAGLYPISIDIDLLDIAELNVRECDCCEDEAKCGCIVREDPADPD